MSSGEFISTYYLKLVSCSFYYVKGLLVCSMLLKGGDHIEFATFIVDIFLNRFFTLCLEVMCKAGLCLNAA